MKNISCASGMPDVDSYWRHDQHHETVKGMILGIGIDIVQTKRIEELLDRYGEKFLHRILTENEMALISEKRKTEFIAGRFAAKEAIIKALGKAISFSDIEILNDDSGKPFVSNEEKLLAAAGIEHTILHISISHDGGAAVGMAILEKIS